MIKKNLQMEDINSELMKTSADKEGMRRESGPQIALN